MKALVKRLKEPSSYAAFAAALAVVGVNIDPGLWQYGVGAVTGVFALIGFLLGEKGSA